MIILIVLYFDNRIIRQQCRNIVFERTRNVLVVVVVILVAVPISILDFRYPPIPQLPSYSLGVCCTSWHCKTVLSIV
jgi:hypothetical protein